MKLLRKLFSLTVVLLCQFPSHIALAAPLALQSGVIRIEDEHFTIRLNDNYRFINAADTVRILVDAWGNPPAQVQEQNPLGMIVGKNFIAEGALTGVVITATHDGHIQDKDAHRIDETTLLQVIRKDYVRRNKERKAIGAEPVTGLEWAVEPHYDSASHKVYWAKDISFGKNSPRTLNYAVRVLGRENAVHFNAVGNMDRMDEIKQAMQNVLALSEFDSGYRYQDFNARYHRVAEYGLIGLISGQPKLRIGPLQNLWNAALNTSSNLLLAALVGVAVALGRWMTRRRLPEF